MHFIQYTYNIIPIQYRYLHFNNNVEVPEDNQDRLIKLRYIIEYLGDKFKSFYCLHEHVAIDEGTLHWKGWLIFRVYNPAKPIKYGIKTYVLADSLTGYCYQFIIYEGVQRSIQDIVLILMEDLLEMNYKLYMDNFYNYVELCELLLEKKVYTTGTLRKNRGEPQVIRTVMEAKRDEKMNHGDCFGVDNGKVTVIAWMDKRLVKVVSTMHDGSMEVINWKKKKGPGMEEITKPKAIIDYNAHMFGVDLMDQMLSYYPVVRRTLKWHKKLFFYLLQMCLNNAHVV